MILVVTCSLMRFARVNTFVYQQPNRPKWLLFFSVKIIDLSVLEPKKIQSKQHFNIWSNIYVVCALGSRTYKKVLTAIVV